MTAPVSIVIPIHNGCELLETLLQSISRQSVAPLEVIVVDNGSTDGAPDAARGAGARVISMGRNAGFAAAVNRGIQGALAEYIALINADVVLDSGWLETLWKGACAAGADFVTGRILQAGNEDIVDGSYDLICRGGCSWRAGAGRPVNALPASPESMQLCSATAALFRAELFHDVGMFEEVFESYLEDVDFGLRCAAAGRKGSYFPDAVCRHRGSATLGRWHPRVVRLIARNQIFLIARHYPSELIRKWRWPILVAHILWGGLAVRHGCGFAWLRGKAEGLWRFASVRRGTIPSPSLEQVITGSEQRIHRLQSETGFDAYWKMYFRLVGGPK